MDMLGHIDSLFQVDAVSTHSLQPVAQILFNCTRVDWHNQSHYDELEADTYRLNRSSDDQRRTRRMIRARRAPANTVAATTTLATCISCSNARDSLPTDHHRSRAISRTPHGTKPGDLWTATSSSKHGVARSNPKPLRLEQAQQHRHNYQRVESMPAPCALKKPVLARFAHVGCTASNTDMAASGP